MKIYMGTDIVSVIRFQEWHLFSQQKLLRIFSQEEINYCLTNSTSRPERFAVRFAAREAFYKALCSMDAEASVVAKAMSDKTPNKQIPFLTVCSSIVISKK